jgi:membrane protein YdbS with pleckstrin-like domain
MQPSVIMTVPRMRPSSKARLLWAINAAIFWVFPFIGQIVWAVFDSSMSWLHVAVFVASVVLAAFHIGVVPLWRYAVHRWEISETAVFTRTGWFSQESRIAPISRVQTVDTERGPIDRLLGLSTVTVTTASSAGAVQISALDQPVADSVVAQLTQIAALHTGDAT